MVSGGHLGADDECGVPKGCLSGSRRGAESVVSRSCEPKRAEPRSFDHPAIKSNPPHPSSLSVIRCWNAPANPSVGALPEFGCCPA